MVAQPMLLEEALAETPEPFGEHARRALGDAGPTRRRFTRDEYYLMADAGVFAPDERVELIEGEVISMAPQGPEHATIGDPLRDLLVAAFGEGYCVRAQRPLALGKASDPEPDVAVVRGSWRDYARAHPKTAVLVVEVSQSSLAFDRRVKSSLYAASDIPEYWVVDLGRDLLEVYREPMPDPVAPSGASYAHVVRYKRGAIVSPLGAPGAKLAVEHLLPPVDSPDP